MSGPPGAANAEAVVIGSRASRLARVQAEWIGARLAALAPGVRFEYRTVRTTGDRDRRTPLTEIGEKGIFTAELDRALAEGTLDLAVHSLKDLPTAEDPSAEVLAIPEREDPRDVLIPAPHACPAADGSLPEGAAVGTSSLRRAAQLRLRFRDVVVRPLRGNVETRLSRLVPGDLDAVVIAAAGLRRLGLWPHGTVPLPADEWLPAPGQGALAVQGRRGDERVATLVRRLEDSDVRAAVTAERAFLSTLGGGCRAPVGALGVVQSGSLRLAGAVYAVEADAEPIAGVAEGSPDEAASLGRRLAEELALRGARARIADP